MLDTIVQNQRDIFFVTAFGLIALMLFMESFFPRRPANTRQLSRWTNNIGLTLLNHYIVTGLTMLLVLVSFYPFFRPDYPLLQKFPVPTAIATLLALFCSELLAYWSHRAFHYFPLLWRFHAIHHNDVEVDATTSYRHHPVESIISSVLHSIVFLWLGAPILALIIYNFSRMTIIVFAHSNLRIPENVDKWLGLLILTPDFHRLHHASDKFFTDSNYGVAVPWFDYLFRTAKTLPVSQQIDMELGLEKWRSPEEGRFDHLLIQPFKKQ